MAYTKAQLREYINKFALKKGLTQIDLTVLLIICCDNKSFDEAVRLAKAGDKYSAISERLLKATCAKSIFHISTTIHSSCLAQFESSQAYPDEFINAIIQHFKFSAGGPQDRILRRYNQEGLDKEVFRHAYQSKIVVVNGHETSVGHWYNSKQIVSGQARDMIERLGAADAFGLRQRLAIMFEHWKRTNKIPVSRTFFDDDDVFDEIGYEGDLDSDPLRKTSKGKNSEATSLASLVEHIEEPVEVSESDIELDDEGVADELPGVVKTEETKDEPINEDVAPESASILHQPLFLPAPIVEKPSSNGHHPPKLGKRTQIRSDLLSRLHSEYPKVYAWLKQEDFLWIYEISIPILNQEGTVPEINKKLFNRFDEYANYSFYYLVESIAPQLRSLQRFLEQPADTRDTILDDFYFKQWTKDNALLGFLYHIVERGSVRNFPCHMIWGEMQTARKRKKAHRIQQLAGAISRIKEIEAEIEHLQQEHQRRVADISQRYETLMQPLRQELEQIMQ